MKDYAAREQPLPPPPPAKRIISNAPPRHAAPIFRALLLAAVGVGAWFAFAHFALAQADFVERLCDTNRDCFERYCAQDMSCDLGDAT